MTMEWADEAWGYHEALPELRPVDYTMEVCRMFDLPPWLVGVGPRPRFASVRWALRNIAPRLVWR